MSVEALTAGEGRLPAFRAAPLLPPERLADVLESIDRLARFSAGTGEERGDTRERILSSALRFFASNGFQGTSIRDIAREVGIKAPGVYAHFSSKESILAAALARALRSFLLFVIEQDEDEPYSGPAEFLVRKHVRFQLSNATVAAPSDSLMANAQFLQEIDPEFLRALLDGQRAYVDLLEYGLGSSGAAPLSNPRTAAHVVITMCDGVNRWYRPGGRMSADEVEIYLWRLVRSALEGGA